MNNFNDEVPNYKKKKPSSISKSKAKSKHKHIYEDCLLIDNENIPFKSEYCTICGKIGNMQWFITEPCKDNPKAHRMLGCDEVYEHYKHLPQFKVNNCWDKFVTLNSLEKRD